MRRFYATVLILGLSLVAPAQSKQAPILISLSADNPYFRTGEAAIVRATFENRTGRSIPRADHLLGQLFLGRTSSQDDDACIGWNNCYMTFYSLPTNKTAIPNRGTFVIELDLAKLQWMDMLDCGTRFSFKDRKQNFFTEVMSGSFNLKLQLIHGRHIIDSNRLLLSLETAKPYKAPRTPT